MGSSSSPAGGPQKIPLRCPKCQKSFAVVPGTSAERSVCPTCKEPFTDLISGYRIERKLGAGGMGDVFLAVQTSLGRQVALKILPLSLTKDKNYVQRFVSEARAAGRVRHENIVAGVDAGEEGGRPYFVMEFVEGETLQDIIKREGPLPEAKVLEIARQAVAGLQAAYQEGLVHRDIKPANIMITKYGTAKICDFGLARDLKSDITLTQEGHVHSSPGYASPEQCKGDRNLDNRTDMYSLGVTLFEAVTKELPFKGDSAGALLVKHVTEQPPAPKSVNPKVSSGMNQLILRLMRKQPNGRFATYDELLETIDRIGGERSGRVPRKSGTGKVPRARKKSPVPLLIGGVGIAVLLVIVLVAALSGGSSRTDPSVTPATPSGPQLSSAVRQDLDKIRTLQSGIEGKPSQISEIRRRIVALESKYRGTPHESRFANARHGFETRLEEASSDVAQTFLAEAQRNLDARKDAAAFAGLEKFPKGFGGTVAYQQVQAKAKEIRQKLEGLYTKEVEGIDTRISQGNLTEARSRMNRLMGRVTYIGPNGQTYLRPEYRVRLSGLTRRISEEELLARKRETETPPPTPKPAPPQPASNPATPKPPPPAARTPKPIPGTTLLLAKNATLRGNKIKIQRKNSVRRLGNWSALSDFAEWSLPPLAPGPYTVELTYAAGDRSGGEFVVQAGTGTLKGKVILTGGWDNYETRRVGTLQLPPNAGALTVKPVRIAVRYLMDLMSVRLIPVAGATPPAQPAVAGKALLPVPSIADQKKVERALREIFADDYARKSAPFKLRLSKKLRVEARKSDEQPTARYVLLKEASDLAAEAGEAQAALSAIDELIRLFDVNGVKLRSDTLALAGRNASTPTQRRALAEEHLALAEEAIRQDDFTAAQKSASAASSIARRTRLKELVDRASVLTKQVSAIRRAFAGMQKALGTLKRNPDDPRANLTVGRYECFLRGRWEKGLPNLARSSSKGLADAAKKDLARPTDKEGRIEAGDAWWDAASRESEPAKSGIRGRAAGWYQRVLPDATGLEAIRLKRRITDVPEAKVSIPGAKPAAPGSSSRGAALMKGLAGYWPFEEGRGTSTADRSGNGNSATLRSGATWTTGKIGTALLLDGTDDRIEVSDPRNILGLSGDMTVSVWVRTTTTSTDGSDSVANWHRGHWIVEKDLSNTSTGWALTNHHGKAKFLVIRPQEALSSTTRIDDGRWHHIAGVRDSQGNRWLYVDGKLEASGTAGSKLSPSNTSPLTFGCNSEGKNYFKGALDEVRIYSRALPAHEIRSLTDQLIPAEAPAGPSAAAPPPSPAPGGGSAWRSIFDGTSLARFKADGWRIVNGAMIRRPDEASAAQSREEFGDIEVRFRFEIGKPNTYFKVRQGSLGFYEVAFNPSHRSALEGKKNELIITCRGDSVTATLNGGPVSVTNNGSPRSGKIQINERAGGTGLRIFSIDVRTPG